MLSRIIFGLLRIWLGWQWITSGWEKVHSSVWTGAKAGTAITGFLKGAVGKSSGSYPEVHEWYASFINHVALPQAKTFSFMVSYGELLAGIFLIIGAFTVFAALGSIFLNLNYLWAGTSSSNPEMIIVGVLIVVFFLSAGYYGLDYWINPIIVDTYNRFIRFLKDKGLLRKDYPEKDYNPR